MFGYEAFQTLYSESKGRRFESCRVRQFCHFSQPVGVLQSLDDFPVRVFADHQAVSERVEVATPHHDYLAIELGAGKKPFRHAAIARHEVFQVTVMHIGCRLKSPHQAFPHQICALEPRPMGFGPTRHVETAVGREKLHHAINVVSVEGRREPMQCGEDFCFPIRWHSLVFH